MTDTGSSPQGPGESGAFRSFADRLAAGEGEAAQELLARYSARLVGLARRRLSPRLATKAAPEDVLQSVYRTFFRRLGAGEVELTDWSSLSGLLSLLTLRKCQDEARRYATGRRDVRREVPLPEAEEFGPRIPDREPTPEEVATFADLLTRLLDALPDRDREVVERLVAGESMAQVAAGIGRAERTVYRTLERVRDRLLDETRPSESG